MKSIFSFAFLFAALALNGCANSSQYVHDGAALSHEFIKDGDDPAQHIGANPTYVALERNGARDYRVLAVSNTFIQLRRKNQEELYFTLDYTNVVPAWQSWSGACKEDPRTEKHTCSFDLGVPDRTLTYVPARDSNFLAPDGYGRYGLTTEFELLSRDSKIIAAAKDYGKGVSQYPTSVSAVTALTLPREVFLVKPENGGELAEYYFVPKQAHARDGEVIETGADVHYEHFNFATVRTPYISMKRIRAASDLGTPNGNVRCMAVMLDIDTEKGLPRKMCWSTPPDQAMQPLWADSPTLGHVQIASLDGDAYSLKGEKMPTRRLMLNFVEIHELRMLTPDEVARINFR